MIIRKKTKKQNFENEKFYPTEFLKKKLKFSFNFSSAAVNLISQFFLTSDSNNSSDYCFSIYSSFQFPLFPRQTPTPFPLKFVNWKIVEFHFFTPAWKTQGDRERERDIREERKEGKKE